MASHECEFINYNNNIKKLYENKSNSVAATYDDVFQVYQRAKSKESSQKKKKITANEIVKEIFASWEFKIFLFFFQTF